MILGPNSKTARKHVLKLTFREAIAGARDVFSSSGCSPNQLPL
jgi:hypothetical protein